MAWEENSSVCQAYTTAQKTTCLYQAASLITDQPAPLSLPQQAPDPDTHPQVYLLEGVQEEVLGVFSRVCL